MGLQIIAIIIIIRWLQGYAHWPQTNFAMLIKPLCWPKGKQVWFVNPLSWQSKDCLMLPRTMVTWRHFLPLQLFSWTAAHESTLTLLTKPLLPHCWRWIIQFGLGNCLDIQKGRKEGEWLRRAKNPGGDFVIGSQVLNEFKCWKEWLESI